MAGEEAVLDAEWGKVGFFSDQCVQEWSYCCRLLVEDLTCVCPEWGWLLADFVAGRAACQRVEVCISDGKREVFLTGGTGPRSNRRGPKRAVGEEKRAVRHRAQLIVTCEIFPNGRK